MSNGFLGSSKNALILAAGVLACAAIAAGAFGSHFTPGSRTQSTQQWDAQDDVDLDDIEMEAEPEPETYEEDTSDYDIGGFAEDTDLIDNTNGMATTPSSDGDVIVNSDDSGNSDDGGSSESDADSEGPDDGSYDPSETDS